MPGIDGRIDFQAVLRDIHAGIQDGAIDRPLLVDSILDGRGESRGVGDITGRTVKIPAAVIKRGQPVFAARHRGDLVAAPQQRCRQRAPMPELAPVTRYAAWVILSFIRCPHAGLYIRACT